MESERFMLLTVQTYFHDVFNWSCYQADRDFEWRNQRGSLSHQRETLQVNLHFTGERLCCKKDFLQATTFF